MRQIDLHLGAEKLTALADRLHFTASANGICRVAFHPSQGWRGMPQATGPVGKLLRQARREVTEYLAGARAFFNVPVDLS